LKKLRGRGRSRPPDGCCAWSYRRTWELVEELNRSLGTPVVATAAGGSGGGGAVLTQAGRTVIERYRAIEMDTAMAARKHLLALNRACANK
jgi:molybdate transport system regulatory protein